jgi:hypothetical protein
MWWLLPGLIALSWLALVGWLGQRWRIGRIDFAIFSSAGGMKLIWQTAAASFFPAVLVFSGFALVLRRIKWPSWRVMAVLGIASLSLGWWGGVAPLWKLDRLHQLNRKETEAQHRASIDLPRLRKERKYSEMVKCMEDTLAVREELIAVRGLYPMTHNHGFSYLWLSLYPACQDLPCRLGSGLTDFLYDAWRYSSSRRGHLGDELPEAMTSSSHPLLRAIGHWVSQDYPAFVKEALAGAEAGDKRMDAMALVAACAPFVEREEALRVVRPILDRGVGLGWEMGGRYEIPSSTIRDYLEGKIRYEDLEANFTGMYKSGP